MRAAFPDPARGGVTMNVLDAHHQRRVALAKLLAAAKMELRRDATGATLPEVCWRQMLPKADAVLFVVADVKRSRDDLVRSIGEQS